MVNPPSLSSLVKVRKITSVNPVPDSDRLDLVMVADWPCVVARGEWKEGMLACYIPADSILPNPLIEQLGLVGKLAGPEKNRIKPIKLRKQLSIGLLVPVPEGKVEGDDVTDLLGITKYEPCIPIHLRGKMRPHPRGWVKYDIDNIRNEPRWFREGEEVVITEKCDGTHCSVGIVNGEFVVNSRNVTLIDEPENLYWNMARQYNLEQKLRQYLLEIESPTDVWIHFEIFGANIQNLNYGQTKPIIGLFDLRFVKNNEIYWQEYDTLVKFSKDLELPLVPLLYRGPITKELIVKYRDGKEQVSGKELHIREGCVIRPVKERISVKGYRVILKCVSPEHLLLDNLTSFH